MNMVGSDRTSGEVRYRVDAQASVTETLLVNEAGDALFFQVMRRRGISRDHCLGLRS